MAHSAGGSGHTGHTGNDGAGVDAPGKESAQRHIRGHAQMDGFIQAMQQFGCRILFIQVTIRCKTDIPVRPGRRELPHSPLDGQRMRRGELERIFVDTTRIANVAQRKKVFDCL